MSISSQLLSLPQGLAILLLVLIAVSFSVAGFLLVHKLIPVKVRRIHNDVAGFVFATLGVTYGVLLAFVVIVVWEQLNDAKRVTENESSVALVLYHNIQSYPDESASDAMKAAFLSYARLAAAEIPNPRSAESGDTAEDAFDQLFSLFDGLVPDGVHEQILYGRILDHVNELWKLHGLRHQAAREELPNVVWLGVLLGAIITIGFTFLFGTENVWAHVVIMSLLAALIAVVVFVVIELDHPTIGSVNIGTPDGYRRILERAGQEGPPLPAASSG